MYIKIIIHLYYLSPLKSVESIDTRHIIHGVTELLGKNASTESNLHSVLLVLSKRNLDGSGVVLNVGVALAGVFLLLLGRSQTHILGVFRCSRPVDVVSCDDSSVLDQAKLLSLLQVRNVEVLPVVNEEEVNLGVVVLLLESLKALRSRSDENSDNVTEASESGESGGHLSEEGAHPQRVVVHLVAGVGLLQLVGKGNSRVSAETTELGKGIGLVLGDFLLDDFSLFGADGHQSVLAVLFVLLLLKLVNCIEKSLGVLLELGQLLGGQAVDVVVKKLDGLLPVVFLVCSRHVCGLWFVVCGGQVVLESSVWRESLSVGGHVLYRNTVRCQLYGPAALTKGHTARHYQILHEHQVGSGQKGQLKGGTRTKSATFCISGYTIGCV